mgnify:CR=1 FL=1
MDDFLELISVDLSMLKQEDDIDDEEYWAALEELDKITSKFPWGFDPNEQKVG